MTVFGEKVLERYWKKHRDAQAWLKNWLALARAAQWENIEDVHLMDRDADGGVKVRSGGTVTVFNVRGNRHRLIVSIDYELQIVLIHECMTHAQYSKNLWKARY